MRGGAERVVRGGRVFRGSGRGPCRCRGVPGFKVAVPRRKAPRRSRQPWLCHGDGCHSLRPHPETPAPHGLTFLLSSEAQSCPTAGASSLAELAGDERNEVDGPFRRDQVGSCKTTTHAQHGALRDATGNVSDLPGNPRWWLHVAELSVLHDLAARGESHSLRQRRLRGGFRHPARSKTIEVSSVAGRETHSRIHSLSKQSTFTTGC